MTPKSRVSFARFARLVTCSSIRKRSAEDVKTRFPLYAKILLWFFLNLLILGAIFYALFQVQFRFEPDLLLTGRAGERFQAVGRVIADDLNARPRKEWDEILKGYSGAYGVQFLLY